MSADYLAPLSNQDLWRLRQVARSGFLTADDLGWEGMAGDCAGMLLDTWGQMGARLPAVSPVHLRYWEETMSRGKADPPWYWKPGLAPRPACRDRWYPAGPVRRRRT